MVAESSIAREEPIPATKSVISGTRKTRKAALEDGFDEPLVDTTVTLPLRSKKLDRQKRKEMKPHKNHGSTAKASLLDLPAELLLQILNSLLPTDVFSLLRVDREMRSFIEEHEHSIAKELIRSRYAVLSRCFPLPVQLSQVDPAAYPALLNEKRQKMLAIHKKPYQHVPTIDQLKLCTCMTCVLAWNNLCVIVDLSHWQKNLNEREPIPMIARGRAPEWNQALLERNAFVVERAVQSPLMHAAVLQKHLASTSGTILRRSRWTKKPADIKHRAYHLSEAEAAAETDAFLERSGPPSYEFPYHRDNYYNLEAYVPNRRWDEEQGKWLYYHGTQHDRDVEWAKTQFTPLVSTAVLDEKRMGEVQKVDALRSCSMFPS